MKRFPLKCFVRFCLFSLRESKVGRSLDAFLDPVNTACLGRVVSFLHTPFNILRGIVHTGVGFPNLALSKCWEIRSVGRRGSVGRVLASKYAWGFGFDSCATETERGGGRLGKRPKDREFKVVLSCSESDVRSRALLSDCLLSLPGFHT